MPGRKRITIALQRVEFGTEETTYRFKIEVYSNSVAIRFLAEVGTNRISFHPIVEGMALPERSEKLHEQVMVLLQAYVDGCRHQQSTSWLED